MNPVFSNFLGFNSDHYESNHQKQDLLTITSKISDWLLQLQFIKLNNLTFNQPAIANSTHSQSKHTSTTHFQARALHKKMKFSITDFFSKLTKPAVSCGNP